MNELSKLKMLDIELCFHTRDGLSASAARLYLLKYFYNFSKDDLKNFFWCNVANNIVFSSLEALVSISTINAFETIRVHEFSFGKLDFSITGYDELKSHRTFLSHEKNVTWDRKYMKNFIENELHVKDRKALRLYQVRNSIKKQLLLLGDTESAENEAVLTKDLVSMIKLCLKSSMLPEVVLPLLIDQNIIEFFSQFNRILNQESLDKD